MKKRVIVVLTMLMLALLLQGSACAGNPEMEQNAQPEYVTLLKQAHMLYGAGDYKAALTYYKRITKQYPESESAQKARFMIGMCLVNLDRKDEAAMQFEIFLLNTPDESDYTVAQRYISEIRGQSLKKTVTDLSSKARNLAEQNYQLEIYNRELRKSVDDETIYLEVELSKNLLHAKMGTQTLYSYPIVSGKGKVVLKTTGREKDFSTPPGVWVVKAKEKDPVWYRPDWYWLETGEDVPENVTMEDRAVPGSLGPFRLNLGAGYAIHGTSTGKIRQGRYSHGCIRMDSNDLEKIFDLADVGTKVFIY